MTTSYQISGMTCKGCTQVVRDAISTVAGVKNVEVDFSSARTSIEMEYQVPVETLKAALAGSPYQFFELASSTEKADMIPSTDVSEMNGELVSAYITAVGQLDYKQLHNYLHSDFKYNGAVNFKSAKDFIEMIKDHAHSAVAGFLVKYDIKAIYADENECCAIYDSVPSFQGREVPFVEWIKIDNGKIVSTEVKFNSNRMKALMQAVTDSKKG